MSNEEESFITALLKSIEGTKSSLELEFDNLTIKLQGTNTSIIVSGKLKLFVYPLQKE